MALIGRAESLARTLDDLARGARLITLHGPGGVGKTALARAFVAERPSATFVPLEGARATADVIALVARALELRLGDADGALVSQAIGLRLATGCLLVLDNTEQVDDDLAALVDGWLERPGAAVLITSQRTLGLPYERVISVSPLRRPTSAARADRVASEAVQLFFQLRGERASDASDEALDQVARIVGAVDGLPLAIELAARRPVPLAQLAADLEDIDRLTGAARTGVNRHRSLAAMVGRSYALLEPSERDDLGRLSVARAPFTFARARLLLDASSDEDLEARLSALVARAVVVRIDDRYHVLEIVRRYARERSALHAVEERLATDVIAGAEHVLASMGTPRERFAALEALIDELPNLDAVAESGDDADRALRAAIAGHRIALVCGAAPRLTALGRACELADARGGAHPDRHAWGLALLALQRWVDGGVAVADAERALELARLSRSIETRALALGVLLVQCGGHDPIDRSLRDEALELLRALAPGMAAEAFTALARGARYVVPAAELAPVLEDAAAKLDSGSRCGSHMRGLLALVMAGAGHAPRALALLDGAIASATTEGRHATAAIATFNRGLVHLAEGDHASAAADFECARPLLVRRLALWARYYAGLARFALGEREAGLRAMLAVEEALTSLGGVSLAAIVLGAVAGVPSAVARVLADAKRPALARFAAEVAVVEASMAADEAALRSARSALVVALDERPASHAPEVQAALALLDARTARTRIVRVDDAERRLELVDRRIELSGFPLLARLAWSFLNEPARTFDVTRCSPPVGPAPARHHPPRAIGCTSRCPGFGSRASTSSSSMGTAGVSTPESTSARRKSR